MIRLERKLGTMIGYLVVLLLALPFVDMVLLFELSQRFGFLRVLAVVLATGVVGAYLVRREGRSVLEKLQTSVTAKEVSRNVLEGGVLLLGAIFLLTPGLLSDVLGVLCVLRPSRERLTVYVAEKLEKSASTSFEVRTF